MNDLLINEDIYRRRKLEAVYDKLHTDIMRNSAETYYLYPRTNLLFEYTEFVMREFVVFDL
jgi:hypothetical protein